MQSGAAQPTLSPSMDIQVATNFERALFEASGRDADWTRSAMADFARDRAAGHSAASAGRRCAPATAPSPATTTKPSPPSRASMRETGRIIDPHTAVGVAAAARRSRPASARS